jgi:hypothetical protein
MIKPIYNHTDFKCTDTGDIIGKRGNIMTGHIDRCGYREVCLSENGKAKSYLVHRLILSTFYPRKDMDKLDVNHLNGDKTDNRLINLEWCTRSDNIKHSYRNGLQKIVTNPKGTYKVLGVTELNKIYELYKRGFTDLEISKKVGCSRSLVSRKIREAKLR